MCTVFGLDKEEVKTLCGVGLKFKDENKEAEGYEVKTSAFKASNEKEWNGQRKSMSLIRNSGHERAGAASGIRTERRLPSD